MYLLDERLFHFSALRENERLSSFHLIIFLVFAVHSSQDTQSMSNVKYFHFFGSKITVTA